MHVGGPPLSGRCAALRPVERTCPGGGVATEAPDEEGGPRLSGDRAVRRPLERDCPGRGVTSTPSVGAAESANLTVFEPPECGTEAACGKAWPSWVPVLSERGGETHTSGPILAVEGGPCLWGASAAGSELDPVRRCSEHGVASVGGGMTGGVKSRDDNAPTTRESSSTR